MSRFLQRYPNLAPLFLLASLLPVIAAAPQDRVRGRIDSSRAVVLKGRVHPLATAQNDRGAVPGSLAVPGMTLLLKSSPAQQSDLQQFLRDQQDPASPSYHKWLTPEQYADRFGASANDVAKIVDWLQAQGFTIRTVARSRGWIIFDGTARQAENTFRTRIHRYTVNGEPHYANATEPSIPAALSDLVAGIRGLHNFHLKPRLQRARPEFTQGGNHYLAPEDFATIYNVAPLYQAGVDGTGQSLVIVGQSAIHTSDITSFRSRFNLSAPLLQQVPVPGRPNPGVVSGDVDEASLDIEWSGAIARNATVIYVYSDDVWQSAMYAVDQNLAPVLSMSYGACELMDLVDLPTFQSVAQQANAEGITWFGPAGDTAAADCEDQGALLAQSGLAVDVPASIPEVTGMGGTAFNEQGGAYWRAANSANGGSATSYIPEQAWNETPLGRGLSGTGGGASVFFARPSWQAGPGVPEDSARHVPDLALASAVYHDPYFFISGGSTGFVGGTSAAAPAMAGILTLLNQYVVSTGIQGQPGLGNINPTLYRLAQSTTDVFHPVTQGDNVVPCAAGTPDCTAGSLGYSTGPAYNQVTGLGSVDAFNLVHQWSSSPPKTSAVVPSIDQNPVYQLAKPDSNGNQWTFLLTLNEEAGIGTTLTDFTIDGASHAADIAKIFGSATIPPRGSISGTYGFATLPAPKTVVFGFTGVDAGGEQWTVQLSVPFQTQQVPIAAAGLSNAATGQQVYAPGMILSVYGNQLASFAQSAATVPLPTFLAGFTATIEGVNAPLYYVSSTQVNIQIPYETQPGQATLLLSNPYQQISVKFQVAASAPGIFTFNDGSVNPSRTAAAGQTVTLFITGEGPVTPSLATGTTPAPATPIARLPKPRLPVTVTVGGMQADTPFVGIPTGLVGVTQINFTVPAGVAPGPQPVVVTVGSASSPPAIITVTP